MKAGRKPKNDFDTVIAIMCYRGLKGVEIIETIHELCREAGLPKEAIPGRATIYQRIAKLKVDAFLCGRAKYD